jgi:hypothetical protein
MIELKLKLPKPLEKDFLRIAREKFNGSKEDALLQALTEFIDAENAEEEDRQQQLRKMSQEMNRKKRLIPTPDHAIPSNVVPPNKTLLNIKMADKLVREFRAGSGKEKP